MNLSRLNEAHYDAMAVVMNHIRDGRAYTAHDIRRDVFRGRADQSLPFTGSLVALLKAMHAKGMVDIGGGGFAPNARPFEIRRKTEAAQETAR